MKNLILVVSALNNSILGLFLLLLFSLNCQFQPVVYELVNLAIIVLFLARSSFLVASWWLEISQNFKQFNRSAKVENKNELNNIVLTMLNNQHSIKNASSSSIGDNFFYCPEIALLKDSPTSKGRIWLVDSEEHEESQIRIILAQNKRNYKINSSPITLQKIKQGETLLNLLEQRLKEERKKLEYNINN